MLTTCMCLEHPPSNMSLFAGLPLGDRGFYCALRKIFCSKGPRSRVVATCCAQPCARCLRVFGASTEQHVAIRKSLIARPRLYRALRKVFCSRGPRDGVVVICCAQQCAGYLHLFAFACVWSLRQAMCRYLQISHCAAAASLRSPQGILQQGPAR